MGVTGNLFSETFEATGAGGYAFTTAGSGRLDNNGWVGTFGAGSVLDADNADVARPTGGGNEMLKVQKVSANFNSRGRINLGSNNLITYTTIYINVAAGPASNATETLLFTLFDAAYVQAWQLKLRRNTSANLFFRCLVYTNGSAATYFDFPAAPPITADQWYKMEFKYDVTNMAYQWLVDGVSQASAALTGVTAAGVQIIDIGDVGNSVVTTAYFDRLDIDSAGFVSDTVPWVPKVIMIS